MEAVVLHRVGFLEYFCPKQGQDFKPSAAPLYPNTGQLPPGGVTPASIAAELHFPEVIIDIALFSSRTSSFFEYWGDR